jgi:hypothetical protein
MENRPGLTDRLATASSAGFPCFPAGPWNSPRHPLRARHSPRLGEFHSSRRRRRGYIAHSGGEKTRAPARRSCRGLARSGCTRPPGQQPAIARCRHPRSLPAGHGAQRRQGLAHRAGSVPEPAGTAGIEAGTDSPSRPGASPLAAGAVPARRRMSRHPAGGQSQAPARSAGGNVWQCRMAPDFRAGSLPAPQPTAGLDVSTAAPAATAAGRVPAACRPRLQEPAGSVGCQFAGPVPAPGRRRGQ